MLKVIMLKLLDRLHMPKVRLLTPMEIKRMQKGIKQMQPVIIHTAREKPQLPLVRGVMQKEKTVLRKGISLTPRVKAVLLVLTP